MEKILNKVQKPLLWSFLIVSALVLVTSLCYMTNYIYIVPDSGSTCEEVFHTLNKTNNMILYSAIVAIVAFAVMCIVGNKYRKKYYIANLVVGVLAAGVALVMAIINIILNISAIGAINSNIAGIAEEIWFYYPSLENASGVALNLGFSYFALIVAILSALIYALNLAFIVVKFIIGRSTKNAIENVDINLSESVGE